MNKLVEPKLAKPGAGLPAYEWAMAKYILLPRLFKTTNKEKALTAFASQSKKISTVAGSIGLSQLNEKRLIPRLRGLEDSSRNWSVAMTLDHLIIVGDFMRQVIIELSQGRSQMATVGTADVKPKLQIESEVIINNFEKMSEQFLQDLSAVDTTAYPEVTHKHPWFGDLNASQWLAFASVHEDIHRKQIEAIVSRL